jgi:transcriptional regulator
MHNLLNEGAVMYIPKAFADDDIASMHQTIRNAGLGHLVTTDLNGLISSSLPFFLAADEGEHGVLYGHLAKANNHWKQQVAIDALVIFMGPDAYVSPSFYPGKTIDGKVVPTWNYIAVHAYGPVEFFDDPTRILRVVTRLTDLHEQSRDKPWSVDDAPTSYIEAQLRALIGIRMPIVRLEGKRKLSQNRNELDRAGVLNGLAESGNPADHRVADAMRKSI